LGAKKAIKRGISAYLVVQEVPSQRAAWARGILGDNLKLLDATLDASMLRTTFVAADIIVNYSNIGETFGIALAEGMAHGLVPIVNSTPHVDNAQVELCENGRTGIVANNSLALADAFEFLSTHPAIHEKMANDARQSIHDHFTPSRVEQRVRRFVIERLKSTGNQAWKKVPLPLTDDAYILDDTWMARYEWAQWSSFRKGRTGIEEVFDAVRLRSLRIGDAVRYAAEVGPTASLRVLLQRLKHGSLRRI